MSLITEDQANDLLHRAAVAALYWFPELAATDRDRVETDTDYVLEPAAALTVEQLSELREVVGLFITNPTDHRTTLLELVLSTTQAAAS